MSISTKTKGLVASVLGLTLAFSLFVGVGVQSTGAQALTAAQLIDLLISLGIIAPDKAAAARSAVGGSSSTPSTSTGSGYNFTRDLQVGSTGDDVKALQQWLNANGYTVATTGAGSMGNETSTFGPATRAALIKFQTAKGITPAAGYFGPKTMAAVAAMGGSTGNTGGNTGGTVVVPTGSEVMVSLASDTPANVALVSGQAIGDLAHFTLKNNSSSEARITSLVLNRIGVSNDSTINNVYVYDGGRRLTDSAVVSSGKITFNEPAGMLVIPAGFSKTISIRADIAGSTAGQILGVALVSVGANVPVLGSFPISGNPLSIASATMAAVDFNTSTTPATASIEPQDGYTVWQNTVTISTRAVDLKSISFRQTGSIQTSDVRNFKLLVDGNQVGSTVAAIDSNNYVTFDLASPIRLNTGGRNIRVVADVVGGSSKNFLFQLRQPSDAMMIDSELMQPVLATAAGITFSARTTGTVSIQGGSLSVTKSNTSPTDNVSVDASNVKLATFEFRAAGENVKVENLDIYVDTTNQNGGLDNGKVFVNGVQVGSTKDLTEATDTNFTFGSSFIVNAGTTAIVDIYADVKTTTNASYSNGSTITVSIGANTSNAQGMTSLNTVSVPGASAVAGNVITVNTATITVSKNSGSGDQTIVAGTTGAKLGSFSISAGSTEGIDVNTITLALSAAEASSVTNLTLKDNATGNILGTVKTTPSESNAFSVQLPIAKSSTKIINIYADVKTDALVGTWQADVDVDGNGQTTGNSASIDPVVALQSNTFGAGSLTLARSASNPESANVVAGSTVKIGQFTFDAVNSGFTVNELKVKVASNGAASSTNGITLKFKDKAGATQTVSQVLVSGDQANATATFTGLTLYVPKGDSAELEVHTTINALKDNNGLAGAAISASIDYDEGFKATPDGGSVKTSVGSDDVSAANSGRGTFYGRVSIPTITKVASGVSTPATGIPFYKFTVKADANGPVEFKKFSFSVATTGVSISDFYLRRAGQSTDVNTLAAQPSSGVVAIYAGASTLQATGGDTVEQIGKGETVTYELRGTVTGWGDTGDSLIVNFTEDTSAVANQSSAALTSSNIIWSDRSASTHTTITADWTNGYLVKDLSADVESYSK